MRTLRTPFLATLTLLAFAVVARAFTVADLQQRADALTVDDVTLGSRIAACPDGQCSDAADIIATYKTLDAERVQLEADRATLPPGSNTTVLDQTLAALDAAMAAQRSGGNVWIENN